MRGDDIRTRIMNINAPLDVILVGRVRQSGEKGELEMIMRVDEARKNQKAIEINHRAVLRRGMSIGGITWDAAYV